MAEVCVQRRLAVILAADVVGYSRMVSEDESGTLAQLKTLRKEDCDSRGAGDSVIAESAEAVLFMLSDAVGFITGKVICVGGGK